MFVSLARMTMIAFTVFIRERVFTYRSVAIRDARRGVCRIECEFAKNKVFTLRPSQRAIVIVMSDDDATTNLVCAEITECAPVEGHDKLKRLTLSVGDATATFTVVTNAPNVETGKRLVVAPVGATLRDGTTVKTATVGGIKSEGMVCDSTMCGWSGGGSGSAALLPMDFPLGSRAPNARPRLDGGEKNSEEADAAAREAAKVKEKEEKKAALAAKRAARDAARKAKKGGAADE
jgi:tRNA-binding EMAP/Myf-like protein